MKIVDELIDISTQLMLAKDRSEVLRIAAQLNSVAAEAMVSAQEESQTTTATQFLKFSTEEISKLPKTFKKEFIAQGAVAHIIKRPSSKRRKTYCYEIRYRRNGYNISAASTVLETAKKRFLEKLTEATSKNALSGSSAATFESIASEWLEHRKARIKGSTHKAYTSLCSRYIFPAIGKKDIKSLRTVDLDVIMQQVPIGRTYEDLRSVLNQIFKYAMHNGLIANNPVFLIPFVRAERKHGTALSIPEERKLITALNKPEYVKYRATILAMLFFGLRPGETLDAKIENGFMVARNSKRKSGKIEYKKIPLTATAERYIDIRDSVFPPCSMEKIRKIYHEILPDKNLYDLRHTFSTRCQQYVRQEIVEVWIGDSSSRLIGNTYTHFPDDFMIKEAKKVDYPL